MGANAQTTVPTFTTGQVLTAAQVNQINTGVPVFAGTSERDAAFGGTGEKTLALGQLCFLESTSKVQFYNGTAWANLGSVTNVDEFTVTGTWTVPAGVTYAIAHIRAGGGGVGTHGSPGQGGTSSVAFASGTISATGGNGQASRSSYASNVQTSAGAANSGGGAGLYSDTGVSGEGATVTGRDGAYIVAGAAVTPAATITVTVGAGGTAGTNGAAGGSGYVWIEYVA